MPTFNNKFYREVRCPHCHKLICLEYIFAGRLAFACPRCGEFVEFEFKHLKTKGNQNTIDSEFIFKPKGGE